MANKAGLVLAGAVVMIGSAALLRGSGSASQGAPAAPPSPPRANSLVQNPSQAASPKASVEPGAPLPGTDPERKTGNPRSAPESKRSLLIQELCDTSRTIDARLKSLNRLEHLGPLPPEGVQALLGLVRIVPSHADRARLCASMGRSEAPEARAELLARLMADESFQVREAAVRALAAKSKDPEIRSALRKAAAEDPNLMVRKEAQKTLGVGP